MYIGSTGPRGLHHLVYEVVDNSVDEALAGYCTHIEIVLQADGAVRVIDDGRGIPVGIVESEGKSAVEVVLTVLHAGGKFGGTGYAVSGGLHGVGVSVVNALSSRLDVEVRRQGFVWRQSYADGAPLEPLTKGERTDLTGTIVTFWASDVVFETTDYDFETLRARMQQMAFLNRGLQISLTDERPKHTGTDDEITVTDGVEPGDVDSPAATPPDGPATRSVTFKYEGGLVDYVAYLTSAKKVELVHPNVIDFTAEDTERRISVEIAMQWTNAYSESVHTYANTTSTTEGGTHEEGFRAAMTTLMNRYARDKGILKEKDDNLTGDDVREGLTAVISVKLAEPQFEGQTKTKLGNTEAKTFVQKVVHEQLGELDRDDGREALPHVVAGEVVVLLLEDPLVPGVPVHQGGHRRAEALLVRTALGRGDRVGVGVHRLGVGVGPLHGDLHRDPPLGVLGGEVDHVRMDQLHLLGRGQVGHVVDKAAFVLEGDRPRRGAVRRSRRGTVYVRGFDTVGHGDLV